jgi:MFS family permease
VLAVAPFRWLLGGQALALVADQAFFVALSWLVLQEAGAGATLGVVLGVSAVPGVLLLPIGGWVVDRVGAVRTMLLAGSARVALLGGLAGLALLDATPLWTIALIGGALSAADALYYPASMSAAPGVVPKGRLVSANSLLQGLEQLSGVAGPVLAGSLIALVGVGATLGAVAVAFAGAVVAYAGLTRSLSRSPVPPPDAAGQQYGVGAAATEGAASGKKDLLVGLRYVLADPLLRTVCLVLAALNVALAGPMTVGELVLAETRFGGAAAFATLMACFGGGSLAGSLATGVLARGGKRGPAFLTATALLGVGLGGLALAPSLFVAGAVGAAMGAVAGYLGVVLMAWLQERTPEAIRGRVMAVVMFAVVALDPVAYALSGALAGFGPDRLFLAGAALLVATATLGASSKVVRAFD